MTNTPASTEAIERALAGLVELRDEMGSLPEAYTSEPASFVESDEPGGIIKCLARAIDNASNLPILPVTVFDLPADQRPLCARSPKDIEQ